MGDTTETNTHGYHINRGVLRALAHAQGQLLNNHREGVLFLALDTLRFISDNPLGRALAPACEAAFRTEQELRPLAEDSQKRGALFAWDRNAALLRCEKALQDIAYECCLRAASSDMPGQYRGLYDLAKSAAAYIGMAQEIKNGAGGKSFETASKINPYICAAFIAEYMGVLAARLETSGLHSAQSALAAGLREQRSKIRHNLPPVIPPVHEIPKSRIMPLYNIMSNLSQTADHARRLGASLRQLYSRDARLAEATTYLFNAAAVYDWQQYETGQAHQTAEQRDNVVKFSARPA